MGNVLRAEPAYLACNEMRIFLVSTGASSVTLKKGVYLSTQEPSLSVGFHLYHGSIAGNPFKTHAVRCTEITETIGNEPVLIDLNGTYDMRSVTIDHIGTTIDAEMSQAAQMATLLMEESLHRVRQMAVTGTLGTAMKRYNHNIGVFYQMVNDAANRMQGAVCVLKRVGVMTEGTDTNTQPFPLNDGCLYPS